MTDWLAIVRGDLDRAVTELPVEQLEELAGALATYQLRAERRLRATAKGPSPDLEAPVPAGTIAAALGVPEGAVREWGRSGRIPCERFGRFVRFRLPEVRAALAANSKTPRLGGGRKRKKVNGSQGQPTADLPRPGGDANRAGVADG